MIGSDGSINDSLTDHTKNKRAVVDSEYISDTNPWDNEKGGSGAVDYDFGPEPNDRLYGVWLVVLVVGAGVLYPYNALITAADYFKLEFPGKDMEYLIVWLIMVPALFFMVFMLRYGEHLSFTFRIFFSFVLLALLILAVPFVCDMEDVAFDMMIAICLCIGILQAISQSSVFGFTALLPPAYNGAAMTGQAVAGIVVCGIRIGTKLSFPDSDHGTIDASRIFFYTACAWCAACAVLFILILRFGFTKHHLKDYLKRKEENFLRRQSSNELTFIERISESPAMLSIRRNLNQMGLIDAPYERRSGALLTTDEHADEPKMQATLGSVWPKTKYLALGAMGTMLLTFLVFPGLTASLESTHKKINDGDWFPIFLISIFNVGDFCGRYTPSLLCVEPPQRIIHIIQIVRWGLYPAFLLVSEGYVHNDWLVYALMFILAYTNGLTVTYFMMWGPQDVQQHEKEYAGSLMAMFMVLGIFLGSNFSLAITSIFDIGHSSD